MAPTDVQPSKIDRTSLIGSNGNSVLNWSVPITRLPSLDTPNSPPIEHALRFYMQFFTGYGETLVDYNRHQTTIGIGIMLTDWM